MNLGQIINKYIPLYGARETLKYSNSFIRRTIEKGRNYSSEEFNIRAHRYIRFHLYKNNKSRDFK